MSLTNDILTKEFEAIKAELISKYEELGMKASGQWANSLEVVVTNDNAKLFGLDYSQQLETGRLAGKFPPTAQIEQWIIDKGIASQIEGKMKVSTLAFLIARKIARQGWDRREHGGVHLISSVVTDARIQSIIDKVGDFYIVEFSNELVGFIKHTLLAA